MALSEVLEMPKNGRAGGVRSIMARWLTVLMALVAQGIALMSPLCFVLCVGEDGHECVELAGDGCGRCECLSYEDSPVVCAVATCGHHHGDEEQAQGKHDIPVGWQVHCKHCFCQHSPLDSAPQVQGKLLPADALSARQDVDLKSAMLKAFANVRALEEASLRRLPLRPHESPHLAVVTTVVLRV